MPNILKCTQLLIAIASAIAAAAPANAQTAAADTTLPARCASFVKPLPPVSDSARAAARDIAGRAQASSIVGDNAAATGLYQRAAQLNPTEPSVAYALGREYEAVHDTRAMGEYCRFLALTPGAPEAADVRQRVAELAFALPPDTTVLRIPVTASAGAPASMPSPGGAFAGGLIIPGLGQFITHRPVGGLLVMAATGAAIFYGLQSKTESVSETQTAIDPFGNPYQFTSTVQQVQHPNAALGFGAAAAISVSAAIEALVHAHAQRANSDQATTSSGRPSHTAAPMVAFGQHSVGLGIALR